MNLRSGARLNASLIGSGVRFLIWGALNGGYQWVGLAVHRLWHRLGASLLVLHQRRNGLPGRELCWVRVSISERHMRCCLISQTLATSCFCGASSLALTAGIGNCLGQWFEFPAKPASRV